MRLVLHITRTGLGGAQRVLTTLANAWAERGWIITLASYDASTSTPYFELSPGIAFRALGVGRGPLAGITRIAALKQVVRDCRPNAVVSFQPTGNLHALLAARGLNVPVVISERNDPAQFRLGATRSLLRRALYPSAGRIVMQTQRAADQLPKPWRHRAVVIGNPVVPPRADSRGTVLDLPRPLLLAVGRLVPQKGFDLLLDAFARIAARHPAWSLVIVGEGPQSEALQSQVQRLRLTERVSLPGATADVDDYLRNADAFVLSSRFEGFPNALCEALAAGLPVVAADCPSGPREIVRPEVDGLLVPPGDVGGLASALDRLLGDPALRSRFAVRAPEILDRFGLPSILDRWDEVLGDVTGRAVRPGLGFLEKGQSEHAVPVTNPTNCLLRHGVGG